MIRQELEVGYKPIEAGDSYGLFLYCSNCDFPKGETLIIDEMKYCWNCGAKIDWSDWNKGE
jgi:hypothetical protein